MRLFFFLLFFCVSTIHAQDCALGQSGWRLSGNLELGRIIPHRTYFEASITEFSWLASFSIGKSLSGNRAWHEKEGYPEIGTQLVLARFGDHDIFGSSIGLIPYIKWQIGKKKRAYFGLGVGLGYLTEKYSELGNPLNNAISTSINNLTRFEYGRVFSVNENAAPTGLEISVGFTATHYSNANTSLPNLGLNVLGFSLGARGLLGTKKCRKEFPSQELFYKKHEFFIRPAIGFGSADIGNMGAQRVLNVSTYYNYAFTIKHRLQLGINLEHNRAIHYWIQEKGEEQKISNELKAHFFVGYEYHLEQLALVFQAGLHFYDPVIKNSNLINRVGIHYYPWGNWTKDQKTSCYFAFYLKSHTGKADYPEIAVGLGF